VIPCRTIEAAIQLTTCCEAQIGKTGISKWNTFLGGDIDQHNCGCGDLRLRSSSTKSVYLLIADIERGGCF